MNETAPTTVAGRGSAGWAVSRMTIRASLPGWRLIINRSDPISADTLGMRVAASAGRTASELPSQPALPGRHSITARGGGPTRPATHLADAIAATAGRRLITNRSDRVADVIHMSCVAASAGRAIELPITIPAMPGRRLFTDRCSPMALGTQSPIAAASAGWANPCEKPTIPLPARRPFNDRSDLRRCAIRTTCVAAPAGRATSALMPR